MSAIETALWDIKGKALGVPVYKLLGGKLRDNVRVYANGWSFRCRSLDDYAREAEKVVQQGYTGLKFYPLARPDVGPHGNIKHVALRAIDKEAERWAVQSVKKIRHAIGPDIDLMVDLSAELTTDVAIRLGRQLEPFDLYFLEEPVNPFDVEALKKVSEHVNIPIAAGERLYARNGFRRVLESHAVDMVQPDPGSAGGLLETKYIAAMAEAYLHAGATPYLCQPSLNGRRPATGRLPAQLCHSGNLSVSHPRTLGYR